MNWDVKQAHTVCVIVCILFAIFCMLWCAYRRFCPLTCQISFFSAKFIQQIKRFWFSCGAVASFRHTTKQHPWINVLNLIQQKTWTWAGQRDMASLFRATHWRVAQIKHSSLTTSMRQNATNSVQFGLVLFWNVWHLRMKKRQRIASSCISLPEGE